MVVTVKRVATICFCNYSFSLKGVAEAENVAVASAKNLANPEYDKILINNVFKTAPLVGYDDVIIHGTPDSFWYNDGSAKGIYLNQRQLTNYLKK